MSVEDPERAPSSSSDADWWRGVAEERAAEIDRLSAELSSMRHGREAPPMTQDSGEDDILDGDTDPAITPEGEKQKGRRGAVPEALARVLLWLFTLAAVSFLAQAFDYDRDFASGFWFITIIIVVTVAMVFLTRRR